VKLLEIECFRQTLVRGYGWVALFWGDNVFGKLCSGQCNFYLIFLQGGRGVFSGAHGVWQWSYLIAFQPFSYDEVLKKYNC